MSNGDENRAALVPSQAAALSCSAATSLARRGIQDLLARAEAEEWYQRGLTLWPLEEIDDTTSLEERIDGAAPKSDIAARKQAVECFQRGLQLDPNHAALQYCLGKAYFDNVLPYDCNNDDYELEFVIWWRKAADQGHAMAQYLLGAWWEMGGGDDYATAAKWYRRAADRGHAKAQFSLGMMYSEGRGVTQDHAQAAAWYRKAAEQGHGTAEYNLAACYQRGQGVPQDDVQAVSWYRKAAEVSVDAERSDADALTWSRAMAQFSLGMMYSEGRGVPQNDDEALIWLRKAASYAPAQSSNAGAYENPERKGIPRDLTQAVAWFRQAIEQEHKPTSGAQAALAAKSTAWSVPVDAAPAPKDDGYRLVEHGTKKVLAVSKRGVWVRP